MIDTKLPWIFHDTLARSSVNILYYFIHYLTHELANFFDRPRSSGNEALRAWILLQFRIKQRVFILGPHKRQEPEGAG